MSIFGRKNEISTNAPVFEGYSCEMNGDLLAIQEGYEDQLAIFGSIHELDMAELSLKADVKALKESGATDTEIEERTAVYEASVKAAISNTWARIRKFLESMWGKLKSFFSSVVRFFDGLFKSGKDFATKYEKELKNLKLEGYKFNMYEYTHLEDESNAEKLITIADDKISKIAAVPSLPAKAEELVKILETIEDKKEAMMDELRGEFAGKGKLDKEEYTEALYAHFRNGATSDNDKQEVAINIDTIISTLKTSKAASKAENAAKDCDKVFQSKIADLTKAEKSVEKEDGEATKSVRSELIAVVQKNISLFSEAKTIALDYFRAWKQAVTERDRVYKSVCTQAFHYKKEK